MNITLKNVPEKVHRILVREAEEQGRSLNSQIIRILQTEAAEIERIRRMRKLLPELDRFAASVGPMDDSSELIREHRDR
jgi:hypothetical protein